jgi:ABC-type amino acid transport system permease subunit
MHRTNSEQETRIRIIKEEMRMTIYLVILALVSGFTIGYGTAMLRMNEPERLEFPVVDYEETRDYQTT